LNDRKVEIQFKERDPQRLDKYLVDCLPEYSRSRLQSLIREGMVLVNGVSPRKSGQMLEEGDAVRVILPETETSDLIPEEIPLDIVYEDDHLMIVNKPAGMVVHPSAGHPTGTLVQAALAHAPEMTGVGGERRPGVVHRLDKNTSGLILMAKDDQTHRWLQDQFRQRRVEKVYIALVDGKPPTPFGRIEASIGRSTNQRNFLTVVPAGKGREAISEYRTLESFPGHTLLEVHPITGRTHQIRLHLQFLGCPVAGDQVYGRRQSSIPLYRHFLHAAKISLQLSEVDPKSTFEAEMPDELQHALEWLRRTA
jgi:23S rRNA pseudouridine1911/1915/1917 synthase